MWRGLGCGRAGGGQQACEALQPRDAGAGEQNHGELSTSRSRCLSLCVTRVLSFGARERQEGARLSHGKYQRLVSNSSTYCEGAVLVTSCLLEESVGIISTVFSGGANEGPTGMFQQSSWWHWVVV